MPQQFSEPIHLVNSQNQLTITIDNETGTISFIDSAGRARAILSNRGELSIVGSNERPSMKFEANKAELVIGARAIPGKIILMDRLSDSKSTVQISGDSGSIKLFSPTNAGAVNVSGQDDGTISLNASAGKITIEKTQNGFEANEDGNIVSKFKNAEALRFDAENAILYLGSFSTNGKEAIKIDGRRGDIVCKYNKAEVFKFDAEKAALYLGAVGRDGDLIIRDKAGKDAITLDGDKGDIILNNADFAEDFDILESIVGGIEPGSVMVLNNNGQLEACNKPYDKKVAGVISGAGKFKPGIVMDKQTGVKNRLPVALSGKVFCKVDASYGVIEVGDLITSSETLGHAMKATDPNLGFGSVIGKALAPCLEGKGLIPILVSLQ